MNDKEIEDLLSSAVPVEPSAQCHRRVLAIPRRPKFLAPRVWWSAAAAILVLMSGVWIFWDSIPPSPWRLAEHETITRAAGGGVVASAAGTRFLMEENTPRLRLFEGVVHIEARDIPLEVELPAGELHLARGESLVRVLPVHSSEGEIEMKRWGFGVVAGGVVLVVIRLALDSEGSLDLDQTTRLLPPQSETAFVVEDDAAGRRRVAQISTSRPDVSATTEPLVSPASSPSSAVPDDTVLYGQVVDQHTSRPVAGARLGLVYWNSGFIFSAAGDGRNLFLDDLPVNGELPPMVSGGLSWLEETVADGDGRYVLRRRPEPPLRVLGVLVQSPGSAPVFRRFEPRDTPVEENFRLDPARNLIVRVTDTEGREIKGGVAAVQLEFATTWPDRESIRVSWQVSLTSPQELRTEVGDFQQLRLTARAGGYAASTTNVVLSATEPTELWLRLAEVPCIEGYVRRSNGGPVAGAFLLAEFGRDRETGQGSHATRTTFSGSDGYFRLTRTRGLRHLICRATGFNPVVLSEIPESSGPLELVVQDETRLTWEFRVTDTLGRPRSDFWFWIQPPGDAFMELTTDTAGVARLENLPPGPYDVMLPTGKRRVELKADESRHIVTHIELPPSGTVEGRVTQGLMIDGLHVRLVKPAPTLLGDHETLATKLVAKDGSFTFSNVPTGQLALVLDLPKKLIQLVNVQADETTRVEFGGASGRLRGRVSKNGEPVSDAEVTALALVDGLPRVSQGVTNHQGEFTLESVDSAAELVRVHGAAGAAFFRIPPDRQDPVVFEWPTATLEISLPSQGFPAGTRGEIYLESITSQSLEAVPWTLRVAAKFQVIDQGRIVLNNLTPARYLVILQTTDGPLRKFFSITSGSNAAQW